LSLGFAYNEGPDPVYGVGAPAVGYDFLQGPIVPSPGDQARQGNRVIEDYRNLPMTSFNKYPNGAEPKNSRETYNYMQGLWRDGDPIVDPEGHTTPFQVAGDPVTGEGWLDVNAEDRRYMMSTGPFTMEPGDTQEVVIAVMVGQGADHLSSISALRNISGKVQSVFDLNYDIPFPPPQPSVSYQPLANHIELIWGHEAEGDVQISELLGQRFVMEGYNVYQGETKAGPWKKIATFDVDNDVALIYKDAYDPDAGAIQRVLDQAGSNSGLRNHLTVTRDRITGKGLINYRPYYFAVTAYSYDMLSLQEYSVGGNVIGHLVEVLETQSQGFEVRPNSVALELVDTAKHISGVSHGMVVVRYFEPENITGHDYEVTFNEGHTWNLQNLTTGNTLLSDQSNQSGDFEYQVAEGLMVQATGPEPGIEDVMWQGESESWVTSVDLGGPWFGGGFFPGAWFFGSSIVDPENLFAVEIRLSNTETQKGYRYFRASEPTQPNYQYQDYREVPLTAWDVSSVPERQLNVCFVEQHGFATADGTWLPDEDPIGAREYLFILSSDYSDSPNEFYTSRSIYFDADTLDVLYAWWPAVAEGHSNTELADGQVVRIDAGFFNKSEDRFVFGTFKGGDDVIAAGKVSLDGIHPVPNPYFHATDLEVSASERRIEFVGLPATGLTIEIYNLAGEMVRELKKENPIDEVVWDVRTTAGLPPASGIYIYRVVVPGVGEKIGKLALFTEVEQVRRF
jgi:hypothetical protein